MPKTMGKHCSKCGGIILRFKQGDDFPEETNCGTCNKRNYKFWYSAGNKKKMEERIRLPKGCMDELYYNKPRPIIDDFETKGEYLKIYQRWRNANPHLVAIKPMRNTEAMRRNHIMKYGTAKPFYGDFEDKTEYQREYKKWRKWFKANTEKVEEEQKPKKKMKVIKRKRKFDDPNLLPPPLQVMEEFDDPNLLPPPLQEFLVIEEVLYPPPPMFYD